MIQVEGKTYSSIQKLADAYKLKASTIREYKIRHNLSWDEVIQHYTKEKRTVFEWEGRKFQTMKEAYRYLGYSEKAITTFAYFEEMTTKEALTGYLNRQYPLSLSFVKVGQITYPSLFRMQQNFEIEADSWEYYRKKLGLNTSLAHIGDVLDYILSKPRYIEKYRYIYDYFETHSLSVQQVIKKAVQSGLPIKNLYEFHQVYQRFPKLYHGDYYIQYHACPSIEAACCLFHVDKKHIEAVKSNEKVSWNGAFHLALQRIEKCQ